MLAQVGRRWAVALDRLLCSLNMHVLEHFWVYVCLLAKLISRGRQPSSGLLRTQVSERARGQQTGRYTVQQIDTNKTKQKDWNAWLTMHNCPSVSVALPGSFHPWTTLFISLLFFPTSPKESLPKGGLSPEFTSRFPSMYGFNPHVSSLFFGSLG